jgi:hypothetical protein
MKEQQQQQHTNPLTTIRSQFNMGRWHIGALFIKEQQQHQQHTNPLTTIRSHFKKGHRHIGAVLIVPVLQ